MPSVLWLSKIFHASALYGATVFATSHSDRSPLRFQPNMDLTDTIIDVLSSSAQYSELLHHIQRVGLVPEVNQMRNVTMFAPVNSAFYNIPNEMITREFLLYHFINQTVTSDEILADMVVTSYATPTSVLIGSEPVGVPLLLSKKWDDDGSDDNDGDNDEELSDWVQPHLSWVVNRKATIVESDIFAGYQRGIVHAIDNILTIPESVCHTLQQMPDVSIYSRILSLDFDCSKEMLPNLSTFLIPNNNAFNNFNQIERKYLESSRALSDREKLVWRHSILDMICPQQLSNDEPLVVTTSDQMVLYITSNYTVNNTFHPIISNIVCSNGLIQTYNSIIDTQNSKLINFTPMKYLYGLQAELFVDELELAGLLYLVDGTTTTPQTLFLSEYLEEYQVVDEEQENKINYPESLVGDNWGMMESSKHSSTARHLYHFMDGQISFDSIENNTSFLATSKMKSLRLGKNPQRVKIEVTPDQISVNGNKVISEEYVIGNTSIYLLDGELTMPPSLSTALGPFFQSSYSLKYLRSTGLLKPAINGLGWTYLLPSRQAWDRESLTRGYLESNKTALNAVLKSMIFFTPFYTDSSARKVELLDGTQEIDIASSREQNDDGDDNASITLTLNDKKYHVDAADILFENGVAHSVHEVSLPASVQITSEQLIEIGGRPEFIDLIQSRNFSQILHNNESYTILVPNMRSMELDGFNENSKHIDLLLDLHIIPGNPIGRFIAGEPISTLAEGVNLISRTVSDDSHFIRIENGQEYEVYVVAMGSTTQFGNNAETSTILFLDGYLSPDWISRPILNPPARLKTHIAMLLGAAVGVLVVFVVITFGIYAIMKSPKEEEDNNDDNSEEQRRPLIRGTSNSSIRSGRRVHSRGDYGAISSAAAETLSVPTSPIQTNAVHERREFGRHLGLPPVN